MTTIKQLQKKYPSYEITRKIEGKRLYIVTPVGEETWPNIFGTLADVKKAIAIAEGESQPETYYYKVTWPYQFKDSEETLTDVEKDTVQKDPETCYNHSLTDADPEQGQYKVTLQQGWHFEDELCQSKSEAIAYADHMWETMPDVSIVDIEYIPETESEETENQIEILRANDNDPWVYVIFQNNLQTKFTVQAKNETRSLWGVYEGDRLCYDIYGLDNAVSYVKGRLG
jgi:hypothetical protein